MPVTCFYIDSGPARGQREIRQHFASLLVAVPESVDVVVSDSEQCGLAPAFYRPVLEERAGMALTERGLRDVEAVARVDERQILAHLAGIVAYVKRVADAKLPHVPDTPAFHAISEVICIIAEDAGVTCSHGEGCVIEVSLTIAPIVGFHRILGFPRRLIRGPCEIRSLHEHYHEEGKEHCSPFLS